MFDLTIKNNVTGMQTSATNINLRTMLKLIKDFKPSAEQIGELSANGKRIKLTDNTTEESFLIDKLDKVLKSKEE